MRRPALILALLAAFTSSLIIGCGSGKGKVDLPKQGSVDAPPKKQKDRPKDKVAE